MFESIVEAVFSYASSQPDKLCLADDNGQATYSEYAAKIRRYASVFAGMGLKSGDTVIVEACQTINYLALQLAMQLIGVVFVPVEQKCAHNKMCSFADRAHAKAVISIKAIDEECVAEKYTYARMEELYADAVEYTDYKLPAASDVCEILFSTGTTGREKGIVITHSNNIALAENVINGVEMEKDNVEMIPSPMNHSHGLRRYYANMYNGCTVVLVGSLMNVRRFFDNIDTFGVNSMDLVPTALSILLKLSQNKFGEYKDRLRYIQFGAAPMIESDQNKICELLPNTRLYNFYGSTESGCIAIYNFNRSDYKKSCIGKPSHNANITIVDDDRNPIESNSENTGLLACKGGQNMLGYWEDEEETAKVLIDGIVYSNDIAYFDKDGEIILLGRKGDVINVGGMKVAPTEVESAVRLYEGISDCICIGVDDATSGKALKLLYVLNEGVELNTSKLRTFLMTKLENYKVPAKFEQVETIARTYNGKLNRKAYADYK